MDRIDGPSLTGWTTSLASFQPWLAATLGAAACSLQHCDICPALTNIENHLCCLAAVAVPSPVLLTVSG